MPRLHCDRLGRGGHVQVGGDERVRVHVRDQAVQRQSELVFRDGASAAGAGVGGDSTRADLDSSHYAYGSRRPAGRGVVAHGDLRVPHPLRPPPLLGADRGGGPPDRPVAGDTQRKVTIVVHGGGCDVLGEVAHVAAHHRPGGDPGRAQGGHAAFDQRPRPRTWVLVPGQQIRGGDQSGLRPGSHVRAPATLPLVVVGDPFLGRSVALHIGAVQVDARPTSA